MFTATLDEAGMGDASPVPVEVDPDLLSIDRRDDGSMAAVSDVAWPAGANLWAIEPTGTVLWQQPIQHPDMDPVESFPRLQHVQALAALGDRIVLGADYLDDAMDPDSYLPWVLLNDEFGELEWHANGPFLDEAPDTHGTAFAVAASGSAGLVAAGGRTKVSNEAEKAWIAVWRDDAAPVWETRVSMADLPWTTTYMLAFTADGGVVAAGTAGPNDLTHNLWVNRYSDIGELVWSDLYEPQAGSAWGLGIAVGPRGDIVVVGGAGGSFVSALVRRYDADGNVRWTREIGAPDSIHIGWAVDVTEEGCVIVGGQGENGNHAWVAQLSR
jgi:hypothetical protein